MHACSLNAADAQQCRGDWGPCLLPIVPGREAVGVVGKVGAKVKDLAPGDRVAVLLGTGLDSEADDDGADRSALDELTTGAASRRLRVPARWAFGVPLELPSQQVCGLLGAGGAVYAQLTQRKLAKGSKVGILGSGAASALALTIADALGMETFLVGTGAAPSAASASAAGESAGAAADKDKDDQDDDEDDEDDEDASSSQGGEYVDACDAEHLRLHTGSFDALIVVSAEPSVDLDPYLPLLVRGGTILTAGAHTTLLSLPPRVLHERRLSLFGPPALSRKGTQALLGVAAEAGLQWPAEVGELTAGGASAALASLAATPDARHVLVQPEEMAKWARLAKKQRAVAKKAGRAGTGAGAGAAGMSSVFGVFSKVAKEGQRMASGLSQGLAEQTSKLVEQVEKEEAEERERREGALQLGMPSRGKALASAASEEEDDDEEDEEEEEDEEGDDDEHDGEDDGEDNDDEEEEDEEDDDDEDDDDDDDDDDDEDDEDDDGDDDDNDEDEDDEDEDDEDEDDEDDDEDDEED